MRRIIIALMTCLALPNGAMAEAFSIKDLLITQALARPTIATARTGAGYLTITNRGNTSDRLLAVEADFPRVMMHDTVFKDEIASMQHMMAVDIPVGAAVHFEPGGKHVMFMGLNGNPFELGEQIPATLVFEQAGRIDITFTVQELKDP